MEFKYPGIPVHPNDKLVINTYSISANTLTYAVNFCILVDNEKRFFTSRFTNPGATSTINIKEFELCEGILISASVYPVTTYPSQASCLGNINVGKHIGGAGVSYISLCSGYMEAGQPLSWCIGGISKAIERAGFISYYNASNETGIDLNFAMAETCLWKFNSLRFILTCDANVHDRIMYIQIKTSTNIVFELGVQHVAAAGEAHTYNFIPGIASEYVIGDKIFIPFEMPEINSNYNIVTVCDGLQAGDVYSSIRALYYERVKAV